MDIQLLYRGTLCEVGETEINGEVMQGFTLKVEGEHVMVYGLAKSECKQIAQFFGGEIEITIKGEGIAMISLKEQILAEKAKGNLVFRALPETLCIAPIDEFVEQPVEGMLYDLNRSEEVTLTFIDGPDPKWVNDFAVALVIRKLVEQRDYYRAAKKE